MQATNPIIPGFSPDPSICRVGTDYFLVCSSFEYFPGVPIYHSRDLAKWSLIGHCLTRISQLPLIDARASGGIYAPTLRHHDGKFWMTTTNVSGGGNFIVSADDPAGQWSEPVFVPCGGIDPSLFWDENGDCFFTAQSSRGIVQAIIEPSSGTLKTEPKVIWNGTGAKAPEGPHLFYRAPFYYLTIAEGGTEPNHMQVMARAESPWGPFEPCPGNPILTHRSMESPIQSVGHADLFEAHDGQWFAVCLGTRPVSYPPVHHLGRETFLTSVHWGLDGWPQVGDCGMLTPNVDVPAPCSEPESHRGHEQMEWVTLRNVPHGIIDRESGGFCIAGTGTPLSSREPIGWVGRRQRHLSCVFESSVSVSAAIEGNEAGLTARMNESHRYETGVRFHEGRWRAFVRRTVGSLSAITNEIPVAGSQARLRISASPEWYAFAIETDGEWHELDRGETRYLSTEVAGGFTGVMLGMYYVSPSATEQARFHDVRYEPCQGS